MRRTAGLDRIGTSKEGIQLDHLQYADSSYGRESMTVVARGREQIAAIRTACLASLQDLLRQLSQGQQVFPASGSQLPESLSEIVHEKTT